MGRLLQAQEQAEVTRMGQKLADSLYEGSGGVDRYVSGMGGELSYVTPGSAMLWARHSVGIRWVYLIELPSKEDGFFFPPEEIPRVGQSLLQVVNTFFSTLKNTNH